MPGNIFSAPFTSFMSQHGILHRSSCAHTPQQNGVAEHKNRHLVETTRTLILHSNVSFHFWGDAVLTACYLINRMPSSVLHDQIPHSLLFPDQPLYFLPSRVFGCTCFVHILIPGQDKLSAKATKCTFLGYSRLQKGYCCYSSETHRYFLSTDVTFFEDSPFFSTSESLSVSEVLPLPIISPPDAVPSRPLQVYHRRHRVAVLPSLAEVLADSLPIPSASPAPAWPPSADLPIALRKASLRLFPIQAGDIGCRWVYTVKVGPDGQVDRLKAHLVVKGYTQVYGFDFGDTFSPVAKIAFVRLLLSMVAMRSWPLYQLDIKNAFLHGDLAEEVYMEQPPGFVAQGEFGLVCMLRRSLYGLKQSPRAWFSRFSSVVQEFGMFHSTTDHSVFYHHNSSGQCIYLTKDLGKLKYFLGIEIAQSSSGVVLSQRKYALDILEETGMLDCKPVDTPMDPNVKLILGQGEPLGDPGRYRRLVGKLNYLTITHPDISFPAKVCCTRTDVIPRLLVTQMQIGLAYPQIDVPLPGVCRGLGYKVGTLPTTYLGLLLGAPYKSSRVWEGVEERFQKRLALWKRQYLLKGGKWCGETSLREAFRGLYAIASSKDAWVIDVWDGGSWGPRFIRQFNDWELEDIDAFFGRLHNYVIALGATDDMWVMHSSVRGVLLSWNNFSIGKKRKKAWKVAPLCIFGLFGRKGIGEPLRIGKT
ncbi:Retrovirus-related Pol polyprotein from transposon TNT 1-94 [Vitis vinifera]|uniref:Retrovirus-related Pol polyprotein from transposon TNT 1-94 n=1 Tax=Vitis vinifera TaxID=29760 RepID=A0A438EDH9_VITVI|nr:Retrovirus-related Pol polyprotein from transposon TNT 1-94 [Vitis vinifera]